MANVINIIQEPISSTSPQINIVQPFVVKSPFYYQGEWGFNLVNGSNDYVVYQDHVGNNVVEASGASFIVGRNNTLSGTNIIVIGDQNVSAYDNIKMFGNYLRASYEAHFYYGEYNSIEQSSSYVVIGAGYDNFHRFNALEAGYNDGFFVKIGDANASVQVPYDDTFGDIKAGYLSKIAAANTYEPILTGAKLLAVESGVTIEKVGSYDDHITDKYNPHEVTKSQVGLGNVNNTSDLDKPISTATQIALDAKQNTLTFDVTPTVGSNNPVTSGGVYTAIQAVVDLAEGKTTGYGIALFQNSSFNSTIESLVLSVDTVITLANGSTITAGDLKVGDVIYIAGGTVPDRWVASKTTTYVYFYAFDAKLDLSDYVPTSRTIAGIALSENISAQSLTDALIYMNSTTDLNYVMGE